MVSKAKENWIFRKYLKTQKIIILQFRSCYSKSKISYKLTPRLWDIQEQREQEGVYGCNTWEGH